jgi:hypothetical protein
MTLKDEHFDKTELQIGPSFGKIEAVIFAEIEVQFCQNVCLLRVI